MTEFRKIVFDHITNFTEFAKVVKEKEATFALKTLVYLLKKSPDNASAAKLVALYLRDYGFKNTPTLLLTRLLDYHSIELVRDMENKSLMVEYDSNEDMKRCYIIENFF